MDTAPSDQSNKDAVFTVNTANASTVPPRTTAGTRSGKTVRERRRERVINLLTNVGAGVFAFDQFDGYCVLARVEDAANALADLAEENKHVAKAIDNMTLAGGYVAVAGVIVAMLAPILARHGVLPTRVGGPVIAMFAPPQAQEIMAKWTAAYAEKVANDGYSDN